VGSVVQPCCTQPPTQRTIRNATAAAEQNAPPPQLWRGARCAAPTPSDLHVVCAHLDANCALFQASGLARAAAHRGDNLQDLQGCGRLEIISHQLIWEIEAHRLSASAGRAIHGACCAAASALAPRQWGDPTCRRSAPGASYLYMQGAMWRDYVAFLFALPDHSWPCSMGIMRASVVRAA